LRVFIGHVNVLLNINYASLSLINYTSVVGIYAALSYHDAFVSPSAYIFVVTSPATSYRYGNTKKSITGLSPLK